MYGISTENIPLGERIYCNRSLNMPSIQAVGFDMDYTLVMYKPETFENLAYEETKKKLIQIGYPQELLHWKFDHNYMIRGLVIDKKRGNVLKIDRYRYVKTAFHGFYELTRDERRTVYDLEKVLTYEEPDYVLIDTMFVFAEAYLFIQCVDLKDRRAKELLEKSYVDIYNDIRACIDLVHRDGSLKKQVMKSPEVFIKKDENLVQVLDALKISGKKIFLLTNSLWGYTDMVMTYVLSDVGSRSVHWSEYFDVVITGAQKPSFFKTASPMYEVCLETHHLKNIDVLPFISDSNSRIHPKIMQGGNVKALHEILNIKKGSDILYVGDHIYGDILRSKKEIGWRTMLVIDELAEEVNKLLQHKTQRDECDCFSQNRERVDDDLSKIEMEFFYYRNGRFSENKSKYDMKNYEEKIEKLRLELLASKDKEKRSLLQYQKLFHPIWGQIMKTGRQNSRFSAQVINYSCLYTSQLTNLRHYGINKNFQAASDDMPHDP